MTQILTPTNNNPEVEATINPALEKLIQDNPGVKFYIHGKGYARKPEFDPQKIVDSILVHFE
jgi:hypothetical protein